MRTRKITLLGLLTAIALTIFVIENQLPHVVPLPYVKLGLSNIVTVFTVFTIGPWEGVAVLFCRVFLGALFSGSVLSLLYSAAGGLLAILVTVALRKIFTEKQIWAVGCLGAIAHSIGQIIMVIFVTRTWGNLIHLPLMIIISIFTGLFTGLCTQYLVNHGGKLWKTIFK